LARRRKPDAAEGVVRLPPETRSPRKIVNPKHVLPALIRKFHDAKEQGLPEVETWGTGSPKREFLHVDDLAAACLFILCNWDQDEHINVGTGQDLSIRELAELVGEVVHPSAKLAFDTSKPDGRPRKLLDVSKLHGLGWHHGIDLKAGVRSTYDRFLSSRSHDVAERTQG
jgi:GDP-L-fucose synthase